MAVTTDHPPFMDHLADAARSLGCSARLVGAGPHGFALALHEALEDEGLSPRFVEYGNMDHVVVQVGKRDCDSRGVDAVSWGAGGRCPVDVDRSTLLRFSVDATGRPEADVLPDRDLAEEVISAARELSGEPTISWRMSA